MRLLAGHGDLEVVGGRHRRPRPVAERARVQFRVDVQREDRGDLGVGQHVFPDHQAGAARFARRGAFLGRLEDQFHRAGDLVADLREH